MASTADLLKGLGGLRLGAFKNTKGAAALQVVVFDATGSEKERD
jgi:hypothetical protein